jgi:hypothetical protein
METLKVYEESPNTLVKMKKGPGRPKMEKIGIRTHDLLTASHKHLKYSFFVKIPKTLG